MRAALACDECAAFGVIDEFAVSRELMIQLLRNLKQGVFFAQLFLSVLKLLNVVLLKLQVQRKISFILLLHSFFQTRKSIIK